MKGATISGLRQRVRLEAPSDTADGAGGFSRVFTLVGTLWARVVPQQGDTQFVEERREQTITHLVTIRWRSDVTSDMRFVIGADILSIVAAYDANGARRFLTCRCRQIS